jgi:hypothetical protein
MTEAMLDMRSWLHWPKIHLYASAMVMALLKRYLENSETARMAIMVIFRSTVVEISQCSILSKRALHSLPSFAVVISLVNLKGTDRSQRFAFLYDALLHQCA